jgi:methenyltetrahydromethanopterin cyclohydrolase
VDQILSALQTTGLPVSETNGGVTITKPRIRVGQALAALVPASDSGWTFCANENQTCTFSGTKLVRYGANGTYVQQTATNSISCNNATFGDPVTGAVKHCDYTDVPPTWTFCGNENQTCTFSGTKLVRYGANGTYVQQTATNSISCNNATFGDPIAGAVKHCDYTDAPPIWTFCAIENQTCALSGTKVVRYGANGTYVGLTATSSISCSNATFGDPIAGAVKHCEYTDAPTWTLCANENQTCAFAGTKLVRYGANGTYVQQTATSSISCSNATFGDPVVGAVKHCDYTDIGNP